MSDRTGDFIFVNGDDRPWASPFGSAEDAAQKMGLHRRAWWGDVFFDHLRGVIDPTPAPHVDGKPYLLIAFHRDFDWTAQHATSVTEYDDPAALLAEAQRMVAAEKRSGSSNVELWEVYGVRVRERRPRPRTPRRDAGVTGQLVEAIRGAPDDDAPRLVWADAIGGERGELVVLQTELARRDPPLIDAIRLRRRQKELLARHGAEWSGLAGLARRVTFHRGFVDAAEIPAETFLEHADEILEAAPMLSAVTVTDLDVDRQLPQLLVDPATRELRGIDMHASRGFVYAAESRGDEAIQALIGADMLRGLRALGIADGGVGVAGVRMLLGMRALHELERLALRDYLQGDAIVALLNQGGLTSLRTLELGASFDMREVAPRLPPTLVEFSCEHVDDAGLAALAASPVASRIEQLAFREVAGVRDLGRFSAFPRLRALSLACSHVGVLGDMRGLAHARLPSLRELALAGRLGDDPSRLARALGPQLELLDLRGNVQALRHANTIKPPVAGELLVGERPMRRDLLRVAPTTHMQWWDHVTL